MEEIAIDQQTSISASDPVHLCRCRRVWLQVQRPYGESGSVRIHILALQTFSDSYVLFVHLL